MCTWFPSSRKWTNSTSNFLKLQFKWSGILKWCSQNYGFYIHFVFVENRFWKNMIFSGWRDIRILDRGSMTQSQRHSMSEKIFEYGIRYLFVPCVPHTVWLESSAFSFFESDFFRTHNPNRRSIWNRNLQFNCGKNFFMSRMLFLQSRHACIVTRLPAQIFWNFRVTSFGWGFAHVVYKISFIGLDSCQMLFNYKLKHNPVPASISELHELTEVNNWVT